MRNFFILILGLLLFACADQGPKITYFKKGDGPLPNDSLLGLYNLRYTTEDGKVMQETDPDNLIPLQLDINDTTDRGILFEVMKKVRKGDSVGFEVPVQNLFSKSFNNAPIPDSIPNESFIQFQVSFVDQVTVNDYRQMQEERRVRLEAKQTGIDNEIIDNYLAENGIDAVNTESGVRYVVTKQGRGRKPVAGETVRVAYTGKLLDGQVFDTSREELAKELGMYNPGRKYEPYGFTLVTGSVIQGWHKGIAELNEGTAATLYIPSSLGYGSRGSGPIIKPNSVLVFDVELVEIVEK